MVAWKGKQMTKKEANLELKNLFKIFSLASFMNIKEIEYFY